jgi:hypothetical protein
MTNWLLIAPWRNVGAIDTVPDVTVTNSHGQLMRHDDPQSVWSQKFYVPLIAKSALVHFIFSYIYSGQCVSS